MKKPGVGIIGYGEFAEFVHAAWSEAGEVEVVAASDLDSSRAPDGLAFYTDWKEMAASDDVDIVLISTPPVTHAPMALESLRAGKHVLVEKPPAMNSAELALLLQTSRETGRMVAVDYMLRFNPLVEWLRAVAADGALGALKHVSVSNYASDDKLGPGHWFWDKSKSGGILVEHAVHFFDLVSFVWPARPVSVTAHGVCRQPGMEDRVVASVTCDDGLVATHYHHFFRQRCFERQSFRFGFDRGEVDIEGWIPLTARLRALVDVDGERILDSHLPSGAAITACADVNIEPRDGTIRPVERIVTRNVEISAPKLDIYADCLRAAICDLARAVRDPAHTSRIALQACADSVRIACAAAEFIETGLAAPVTV